MHTLTRGAGKNAESWPDRGCGRTVLPVVDRQVIRRKGRTYPLLLVAVMFRRVPWRKVLAWSGLLAAAVVVVVAAVYVIFWPVSDLIARHDVGAVTGRGYGAALQAARDAARGRLVAFGAGLFAAGALIYTARNFSLARQGQVTDRYTKAIEQLGSSKELDVRIGGIYALERIARDSPRDHPTIMEVLAAFIRDRSSEQWPPAKPDAETPERETRPDVQAAVTVIGRRNIRHDRLRVISVPTRPVDLHSAVLTRADLHSADLDGARLDRADLTHARLDDAHLTEAYLLDANFTGAVLTGAVLADAYLNGAHLARADLSLARLDGAHLARADLTKANLKFAHLERADLHHARLAGARLTGADLTEANLKFAHLNGADLTDADLTGARLDGAHLTGARWSPASWRPVRVPEGWTVDDSGRLKRGPGQLSEIMPHHL